jgi:hypothetical protein
MHPEFKLLAHAKRYLRIGSTPAPDLIRGDSVFLLVPSFRRDDVWIPAFAGMTVWEAFYEVGNVEKWNFEWIM